MIRIVLWRGLDTFRTEIAYAELDGNRLSGRGTQIGTEPEPYELRYELESEQLLRVEIVGRDAREIELGDGDFFDLGFSPLFNSLPIRRYGLHRGGDPRDFVMTWVSVPDLEVHRSEQRYEPVRPGLVRFVGSHRDDRYELELDEDGLVVRYPALAERVL